MKRMLIPILVFMIITSSVFATGEMEAASDEVVLERVAFTCQDLQNPFFKLMGEAVTKAAHDIGGPDVKVMVESADNDLNKQFQQIDDFISAGVQIIVLNAADSEGIAPAVRRAKEAGIVVIASDVTAAGGTDATMTSNNFDAGYIVAEYIAEELNGKGNVVALIGDPVSASLDRKNGFDACMKEYPGIKVLSDTQNGKGRRELSMNLMTDLLTAFPKIDAVWCVNDPTALGAELAIKQAKRDDEMFVVGVDGSPDAALSMKQPGSIFAASAAQDPYYMAYHAVEVGWDVMNGKMPENPIELIPVKLITQKEVKEGYAGWAIPE
ncbi:MAG: ABC transporter substrate-binding protein [Sphaerochaetaceae bacterium]|nr:ABC transporter substrate-binding protein [Sphaerochaetaceae bacterium]